jgi:hypothetical protein
MTEDEARSILEAIRKVSDLEWDAMPDHELLELRLRGLSGRAFAAIHHIPDPDHDKRTAPCLYVVYLPDPESFLLGSLKHELRALEVPGSVAEIDGRKWLAIDPAGSQSVPEKSGRSGGRDGHALEGFRWKRTIALAVTAALCLYVWWAWNRNPDGRDPGPGPSKTPLISPATARRWNETRRELKSLLQEPWAKTNTGIKDPDVLKDHDLVNAFASLFKRPDITGLPGSERLAETLQTEFDAHPFASFLHRLPVDVPTITKLPGDVERSQQYLDYLSELASALKESEINIETNSARDLVQSARLALDYHQFFDDWRTRRGKKDPSDYWCDGDEALARWVKDVRSIIKTKYPFHNAEASSSTAGH